MKQFLPALAILFVVPAISSMKPFHYIEPVREEAYVPVYGVNPDLRKISFSEPKTTVSAGKIYVLGETLYQVENQEGIHVIDYSDPKNPEKIAFLNIAGCAEVAVKNNIVLTNNINDLVSIDISDLEHPREVGRVPRAFETNHYFNERAARAKPPYPNVYFECPNGYSGDVVGWELKKNVRGAHCHTN